MNWSLHPQTHFESVDSTGLPYQVIMLTDSLDDSFLQIGDEIGLFADTLCVGADTYNGSGNFAVTAWEGSEQYNLPGFEDGDSIRIFIWTNLGNGFDEYELDPVFTTGNGTFGFGSYSACYFSLAIPVLEVSETEHDFGTVSIGNESDGWTFTIKNSGTAAMTFGLSLQNDSVFTLSYYTISSLEPQDSLQVGVHFVPVKSGVFMDTIFLTSTDPVNGTAEIILFGTGEDTTTISTRTDNIPLSFQLKQNYPNPFNSNTQIYFGLTYASPVEIIVYNIRGNHIRTMVQNTLEAGFHSVFWNGRNDAGQTVSSGFYFYRIHAGLYSETRKMVMIR